MKYKNSLIVSRRKDNILIHVSLRSWTLLTISFYSINAKDVHRNWRCNSPRWKTGRSIFLFSDESRKVEVLFHLNFGTTRNVPETSLISRKRAQIFFCHIFLDLTQLNELQYLHHSWNCKTLTLTYYLHSRLVVIKPVLFYLSFLQKNFLSVYLRIYWETSLKMFFSFYCLLWWNIKLVQLDIVQRKVILYGLFCLCLRKSMNALCCVAYTPERCSTRARCPA